MENSIQFWSTHFTRETKWRETQGQYEW